ncbi:MAG TPA: hypothetical protein VD996_09760 [Chitinophagaceae bacterium]|nr:hypothetical protein [Chitinophagaceae bacterium]
MRKFICFLMCMAVIAANGQTADCNHFLGPVKNRRMVYAALDGDSATIFRLGMWLDKRGTGYSIDTSLRIAVSQIERSEGKLYVDVPGKASKMQKVQLDSARAGDVNGLINNACWWDNFLKLTAEIKPQLKYYHFSFREGFGYWEKLSNTTDCYKDFKVFAGNRIRQIRDSLLTEELAYARIADHIINNMATIDYQEVKDSIVKLPTDSYPHYHLRAVVNEITRTRPEFFFKLADDLPELKGTLFAVGDWTRQAIKNLRGVDTASPSKKHFFRKS